MAVPFGKLLEGSAVPNTVTKSMHTEKYFYRDVSDFTIEEKSYYSTLENQVRTIKSFNRPVILVDDLLHKGGILLSKDLDDMKLNIHKIQCVLKPDMKPDLEMHSEHLLDVTQIVSVGQ